MKPDKVEFENGIRTVSYTGVHKASGRVPFFNRELSWLSFNRRVLEQALNPNYPLLERVRYLGFVSSNLDEFFEIRVAGLIQQVESSGTVEPGPDGLSPAEQLKRIREVTVQLVKDQYKCWNEIIVPELRKEDIHIKGVFELNDAEESWAREYFETEVFPVLTPLAIDPAHPFPSLINKSLNVLVELENPEDDGHALIAILPIPRVIPRVIQLPETHDTERSFVLVGKLVKRYAGKLFPGMKVKSSHIFRITRNSDLYIDEEELDNLLNTIEEELHKLKKGDAVRLEVEKDIPEHQLKHLLKAHGLSQENVYLIDGPMNMMRLTEICDLVDDPKLKFSPYTPYTPPSLSTAAISFDTIRKEDFLLHHPFESFQPFVDFLHMAADDPKVFAIKQTLYRTSGDSPIIEALMKASMAGKQVTALIEIKARFDEQNNIQWAKRLEEAGVHVVYGLVGLKTHCKCCLIVRRDMDGMRHYAHIGTGNYNPKTARLYTDLSFMTANPAITQDVAALFNTLTGFSRDPKFNKLLVAPFNLQQTLCKYMAQEAENARAGLPAKIIVKANSLIDKETISHLYAASQAGVKIELIIRGICGIVPGLKGLSENIRVRSILGRYLEHHRIFYFENGESDPHVLIGSADWMPRNFYRRIEAVVPIENEKIRERIISILDTYIRDNANSKLLRSNGAYTIFPIPPEERIHSAQDLFTQEATEKRKIYETSEMVSVENRPIKPA
jgi:polyphosphate kinase